MLASIVVLLNDKEEQCPCTTIEIATEFVPYRSFGCQESLVFLPVQSQLSAFHYIAHLQTPHVTGLELQQIVPMPQQQHYLLEPLACDNDFQASLECYKSRVQRSES